MFCLQFTIARVLWSMKSMRNALGVLISPGQIQQCWSLEVMMARSVSWHAFGLLPEHALVGMYNDFLFYLS